MLRPLGSSRSGAHWKSAVLLFCLMMGIAATAQAQNGIDTIGSWNGSSFISSFGVTDTATYGQVISVPSGASPMTSFSFEIGNCGNNVTMRGEVYAWNGTMATGSALYESAPFTLTSSAAFQLVTFNTGSLSLAPGNYVIFASTSKDQTGAPSSACRWGALTNDTTYGVTGDALHFVFENNTTNVAQWTGSTWSVINEDLAFRVGGLVTAASPAGAPAASTTSLIVGILALIGVAAFMMSRMRHRTTT